MGRDGLYKRGQYWWISYKLPDGTRVRESTETSNKVTADAIRAKKMVTIAENKHLDVKRLSKITLAEFGQIFLERYSKPKKRTWKETDERYLRYFTKYFGDIPLIGLTQEKIERFRASRLATAIKRKAKDGSEKYLTPSSSNRELSCLKTMCTKAVEWEYLSVSPCAKVRKLKENVGRTRFLTGQEIEKLLAASSPRLKPVVTLLIQTGMRKGELRRLKWSDLDFDQGIITLPLTKNGKVRYVPMNQVIKNVLLHRRINKESPAWVFPGDKPEKPWDFDVAFRFARKRAGLDDVRIQDLRHTFASHLCMKGVDIMTVKELLGHSSLEMTQRYSHLTQRHKTEAVARLETISEGFVTNTSQSGPDAEAKEFEKIVSELKSRD